VANVGLFNIPRLLSGAGEIPGLRLHSLDEGVVEMFEPISDVLLQNVHICRVLY